MKEFLKRAAALVLSAVMTAAALPLTTAVTGMTASAAVENWDSFYDRDRCSLITTDTTTYHGDSGYSIKISNEDYNVAYAQLDYTVKPNTIYKFSAWVKYSGCSLDPDATVSQSGARLGHAFTRYCDGMYSGKSWKLIEYEFRSGDSTACELALYNGIWDAKCKGTAWFSDIKLEECSYPWDDKYDGNNVSEFLVDTNTYYGDSGYSIKITNNDYNVAYVEKTFSVKRNTNYRASVMVKYTGYSLAEDAEMKNSGATFGQAFSYNVAECSSSSGWKKLTFEFNSGEETGYKMSLNNGLWNSRCKGTAWFSDFRLEECVGKPSTKWNVLAVVFKNVKAPVEMNGKKYKYESTLNEDDVKYWKMLLGNLYSSVPLLSDGLWGINSIDVVSTDAVVDELAEYNNDDYNIHGYMLQPDCGCIGAELDKFIAKAEAESGRKYDQIVAVSSLDGVSGGWLGLGGSTYKDVNFCQITYKSGDDWYKSGRNFQESAIVHEMLHCVERISRYELQSPTQKLHAGGEIYGEEVYVEDGQNGWDGWGTYYSDYIRSKTPDGLGVDKRAFYTYRNSTYKVVYGSELTAAYTKTDVSKLTVSKPKASYIYTGKAIKPELTVKDGSRKLTKGKDYTLSYYNNTETGLAAVVVEGKGDYAGKYSQNFIIKPQKAAFTVTKNSNRYSFRWKAGTGANKFEIYCSTNGGKSYKLLETVDAETNSTTIKLSAGRNYRFKIRSVKEMYPQKYYGSYSAVVTAKTATSKNSNETFKYGRTYVIQSKNSGLVMDIADASKKSGADLIQYAYSGKNNQKWYLEQQSNGYYVIKNSNSGMVISVDDSSNALQQKYTGAESQQWLIKKDGDFYKIINRSSGKSLDVLYASKENGATIFLYPYYATDNQLWSIKQA